MAQHGAARRNPVGPAGQAGYHSGPVYELPGAYVRDLVDLVARRKVTPEALLAGLPITLGAARRSDDARPAAGVRGDRPARASR